MMHPVSAHAHHWHFALSHGNSLYYYSFALNKDSLCYGQCMDDSVTACTSKQTTNFQGSLGLLSPLESEAFWFQHS